MPVSRPGDLWLLGPHRLLCGDCTSRDRRRAAARRRDAASDGHRPALRRRATTRPGATSAGAAATKRTGKVLNDDRADWREAWALFPGDVAYVWHGALHATTVAESLDGLRLRHPLADHLGQGAAGAQPRRLPLAARAAAGTRCGRTAKGHWAGDRKQTTLWQIASRDQDADDGPRHAEAGRVHAPADAEQLQPRPGGLRAVLRLGHHDHRRRDHRARLPRHGARPGLCRCRR